jgi:deoxyribodipyrimidine photolyase
VIRRGPVPDALGHLACERGAKRVYFSRRYEPASRRQETAVRKALATDGVDVRDFGGALLYVRRSSLTRVRTTRLTGVGHPTVDSPSRFESA